MARQEPITMATRLTEEDARLVKAAATANGISPAAFIRVAVVELARERLRLAGGSF